MALKALNGITAAVIALGLLSVAGAAEGQPAKQLSRRPLPPGRRIRELHFSPDGRLLLAQDDSGLTVLTVQPFSVLFRVPADNVTFSGFTPDSRQVLCVTFRIWVTAPPAIVAGPSAHLERWSVADRTRVESIEIPWTDCGSWGLSPDGRVLACLDSNGTLSFVDVASSATIFKKKNFNDFVVIRDQFGNDNCTGDLRSAEIDFSPDGRFVLVLPVDASGSAFAWDLRQRKAVGLTVRLKIRLADMLQFAFIAPDRLLISRTTFVSRTVTATLAAFPSGKVLSKPVLPQGPIYRAADPNFVIVRPFAVASPSDFYSNSPKRSAAVEIRTGQVIVCNSPALDVFGQYYAAERTDGELGLYERGKGLQATVMIADKP
ncbi:MAG: WD40 repeat domain-containing protein [Bryobacteraceae bacterium]